jgi:hypothetical protein
MESSRLSWKLLQLALLYSRSCRACPESKQYKLRGSNGHPGDFAEVGRSKKQRDDGGGISSECILVDISFVLNYGAYLA